MMSRRSRGEMSTKDCAKEYRWIDSLFKILVVKVTLSEREVLSSSLPSWEGMRI
jgi:hypothetical protein